jgi:hypothetical protein
MCRHNGDKREMLHFLVVHADDILTIDNQIRESGKNDVGYANTMLQKDYDNHRMAYINKAENLVCEIVNILYLRKYDKSLAYYVIYTAYIKITMMCYYSVIKSLPRHIICKAIFCSSEI